MIFNDDEILLGPLLTAHKIAKCGYQAITVYGY